MTLVSQPLGPASQMLDFVEWRRWITGCYIALQIWYGHWCMTLVPGPSYWEWNSNSWRVGAKPTRTRGSKCEKRRPHSRAPRGGAIDALGCGVPHGAAIG
jgi:hypothetical protein